MKVRKAPRLALRISRLMGRLDGGMDRDTTRTGAIGALYMRSVRLARSHRLHGAAYRRAQDRLLRQAWAVVRSGGGDGDD